MRLGRFWPSLRVSRGPTGFVGRSALSFVGSRAAMWRAACGAGRRRAEHWVLAGSWPGKMAMLARFRGAGRSVLTHCVMKAQSAGVWTARGRRRGDHRGLARRRDRGPAAVGQKSWLQLWVRFCRPRAGQGEVPFRGPRPRGTLAEVQGRGPDRDGNLGTDSGGAGVMWMWKRRRGVAPGASATSWTRAGA